MTVRKRDVKPLRPAVRPGDGHPHGAASSRGIRHGQAPCLLLAPQHERAGPVNRQASAAPFALPRRVKDNPERLIPGMGDRLYGFGVREDGERRLAR